MYILYFGLCTTIQFHQNQQIWVIINCVNGTTISFFHFMENVPKNIRLSQKLALYPHQMSKNESEKLNRS